MRSGILHINGSPAPQVPAGVFIETYAEQGPHRTTPRCIERGQPWGQDCTKTKAIETLPNGMQHAVLDAGAEFGLRPAGEAAFHNWLSGMTNVD